MPNPNNVKALYDELQSTYNLGSYDDFLNYLSDDKNREALRKELSEEYEVGDIAQFSEYLGFGTGHDALEQFKRQTEGNTGTPNYVPNRFGMPTQQGAGPVAPTVNAQPTTTPQQQQDKTQYNYMPMGSIQTPAANQPAYTPQRKPMAPAPKAGQWSGAPMQQTPFAPTEEEGNTQYMPLEQGEDTKARYDAAKQAVGGQVQTKREEVYSLLAASEKRDMEAGTKRTIFTDYGSEEVVIPKRSNETRELRAALRALDNTKKMIDEANAGNKNFFAGAGRGMRDKLFDVSTWDFGITDLTDQAAIMRALEAYDKGEQLTESQQALLDAKAVELATTAYFGSELGRGYKAGQVTAEAIPFMIEMAINPAAGIGKGASKAMVRYALKKFGKEAIQKGGKRYVAKLAMKYGTRIALDPVGAGGMAVTTGAARTAADAMQRMAGNLHYGTDEQGNITFDGHTDAESVMKAFGKAFASTTIENYSEMLGNYFGPALGLLGKGASKVGKGIARTKAGAAVGRGIDKIGGAIENAYNSTFSKKIGLQAVSDFISKVPAGKVAGFLSELEKRAQWHGVMGEYTEEIAGGLLNALVVGDQTLDKDPDTGLFNWDNNVDTFLGVALMGGFFSGVKTVGYGVERAHNARQYNKANRMGASAFGDGWADVQTSIDNDPKAGAVAVLADPNATAEQREAALRYAAAVAARQGMEQGKAKRDAEGVQTPQEAAAEQSYNAGYEDANTDELRSNINQAYNDARQKLVGLIGEDNVGVIDEDPLGMQRLYDNDPNVSDEVTWAVAEYVSAKSAMDGVNQRIVDDAEDRAEEKREAYKPMTREDGTVHPVTLNEVGADGQPKTVYLLDGSDVVLNPDGSIDREKSSPTLTAYDPEQGKPVFINDPYGERGIQSVGEVLTQEDYEAQIEAERQAEVERFERGNRSNRAQGARTPGAPEAYTPGMVMGVVDDAGQEHVAEVVGRVRYDKGKFVPDENGMFVEYTVDGQTRHEAVGKLNDMVRWHDTGSGANGQNGANGEPQTPAEQPQQPNTATEGQAPTAQAETPTEGGNAAATQPQSGGMPMKKDGNPDFMATTPQQGYDYIYNDAELSPEEAQEYIQANTDAANKALEDVQKKAPKMSNNLAKYKQERSAWQQKLAEAEAEVDYWQQLNAIGQQQAAAFEAPAQPTAQTGEVPDMSVDKASNARERGYRLSMGNRYDRQESTDGVEGSETEVKFANSEKPVKGRWKVVEADKVQPSHMGGMPNPMHFIPEAQPKDRTDNVSGKESDKIAANINPKEIIDGVTAYTGAPVVNSRGEVIQGNNRAIALRKMPEYAESSARYKQYLIDHAAEYGLNAEDIASMNNPVMVREVDVDDNEAIRLGQFTASDTESGGKERISADKVLGKLTDEQTSSMLNIMLRGGEETDEMTVSQLIDRNGADVLTYLAGQGAINDTQVQSAYGRDGRMTPEAKNDLADLVTQNIFKGGADNIKSVWEKYMPVAAQKALLQAMAGDMRLPVEDRLIGEVRNAIMAVGEIKNNPFTKDAKTEEEYHKGLDMDARQADMLSRPIKERYSELEIDMAVRFLTTKQNALKAIFVNYQRYVTGTNSSLFEEAQKISRAEAIEKAFGVTEKNQQDVTGKETETLENGGGERGEELGHGERPAEGESGTPAPAAGEPGAGGQPQQPAVNTAYEPTEEEYAEIKAYLDEHPTASRAELQRALRLGYNKAEIGKQRWENERAAQGATAQDTSPTAQDTAQDTAQSETPAAGQTEETAEGEKPTPTKETPKQEPKAETWEEHVNKAMEAYDKEYAAIEKSNGERLRKEAAGYSDERLLNTYIRNAGISQIFGKGREGMRKFVSEEKNYKADKLDEAKENHLEAAPDAARQSFVQDVLRAELDRRGIEYKEEYTFAETSDAEDWYKKNVEGKAEQPRAAVGEGENKEPEQSGKVEKVKNEAAAPKEKIDDVGEKIGGARKDLAQKMGAKINLDADTFPKMFPKFDLKKAVEQGLDPKLASAVYFLRLAAQQSYKSNQKHHSKEYALNAAKFMAAYAKQFLERGDTSTDFMEGGFVFTDYGKKLVEYNLALYEKVYAKFGNTLFDLDLTGYEIVPIEKRYGTKYFRKNEKGESVEFQPAYEARAGYTVKRYVEGELDKAIDELVNRMAESVSYKESHPYKLSHYYMPGAANSHYIGVKLGGKVVALTEKMSDKEASQYLSEHEAELQEKAKRLDEERKQSKQGGTNTKWKPELGLGGGRARVGEDYRNGKDVSAEDFRKTFGFRGVEFGNYVTQAERQRFINEAYDAMMDLAALLNVSPRALSLGGRLGFAIGARGGGNAMAHYEPDLNVINLTKSKGAGSLAHEWWHALDYYFNRMGDRRKTPATANRRAEDFNPGQRREMEDAFVSLMEKINGSDYRKRSVALDAALSKDYYTNPTELGARAFQDYVQRRLTDKGQVNDFLSSFTPEEQWNGKAETYPYPTGKDADVIDERFDSLFGTMLEREDEQGNVMLYERVDGKAARVSARERKLRDAIVDLLRKAGIDVVTESEEGQRVLDMANGRERQHRVYHGSGADFEAFDHTHMGEGEGAQAFGWGTYVTEVEGIGRHYAENLPKVWFRDTRNGVEVDLEEVRDNWDESDFRRVPLIDVFEGLRRHDNNIQEAIEVAREIFRSRMQMADEFEDWSDQKESIEAGLAFLEELSADDFEVDKNLYTVEIPEDNGSNYLEWDKPIGAELAKKLQDFAFEQIMNADYRRFYPNGEEQARADLQRVIEPESDMAWVNRALENRNISAKAISEFLHSAGFVGVKYPAEYYSGGRSDGAKNYVIFNEGDLQITDKVRFFRTESGEAYGFTMGGKIYLDPKIATAETPVHEYTHLWAEALRQANPKAWEQLKKELEKDKELVAYVRRLYPELAGSNGANGSNGLSDELAEEVFAYFSGRRGAERLREEQRKAMDEASDYVEKAGVVAMFERLRDALKKFWNAARDLFAGKTRVVEKLSAEDFADMVLGDLLNGVKPDRVDSFNKRNADIRYQRGGETFEERQRRAVAEKGIVAPGLNGREVTMVEGEKYHGFKTFDEARNWAKENIAKTYDNEETGGKGNVRISNTAIDKFLSESSVRQSEDRDIHMSVLKVLPEVIREGVDAEQHPDYKKGKDGIRKTDNGYNDNVLIHRVYGAVSIDGNTYRVKVTLKEEGRNEDPTKAYSYEATKIELLDGQSGSPESLPRNSNNSISAAKLLKNIEKSYDKGKKLLDESSSTLEDSEEQSGGASYEQQAIADAMLDRMEQMGMEVSTDISENRKAYRQARQDNSEEGKLRHFRTSDGKVYGFAYRGAIYLDPRHIDAELPVHEYAHLWCEAFRRLNPGGWREVVETMKRDGETWELVKSLNKELTDENDIAEEIIAIGSGKNGKARAEAEYRRMNKNGNFGNVWNNIAKAIQDFWRKIGDFLNIKYESAEQIYDQVVKDFAQKINPRQRVEDWLKERDKAYLDAVEKGDTDKAKRLFEEALRENIGNGMTPYIAVGGYRGQLDRLARGVKSRDPKVISEVADLMAPLVPKDAVLVPAPSHSGKATDMLDLTKAIAERAGVPMADVLSGTERESQKEAKRKGQAIASAEMGIEQTGELPAGRIPIVIDNVVNTGNTAEACVKALGRGMVLSLADAADRYKHVASLKSAEAVVRDRNGEVVPLSKRFDLGGSRYLAKQSDGGRIYREETDEDVLARLESGPKEIGYRNVVLNEDGTLGSPMGSRLGQKGVGRRATSTFVFGKWERSDENPDLANDNGKIDLIKPDGKTVDGVDYNPYIHIRPTMVNKQFKQAWERPNLVYVRTEYPASELTSGYKAEKANKSVGKSPWNGGELILSRWDKPIEIVPWEEVADDWEKEFKGQGIHFDIIPPKLLPLLVERGMEILPPHKGMGKACNEAYERFKRGEYMVSGRLYREEPVFYSNAMRAVENIKQERATPEQWVKMIEKQGGLKAGEDKWLGLSEWLNGLNGRDGSNGKPVTLTKQEVLDYIRANEIQIEEVEYGDIGESEDYKRLNDRFNAIFDETSGTTSQKRADKAFEKMAAEFTDGDLRKAFSYYYYVDDNGETHVHLLIGNYDEAHKFIENNEINATRLRYSTKGLDNKREIAFVVPTAERFEDDEIHFGELGGQAIMWVRFGETTDAYGKRVLVIDEIQSNRHQEGREKGYKDTKIEQQKTEIRDRLKELEKTPPTERDQKWDEEHTDLLEKRIELYDEKSDGTIPDAPFDKNWHEVAMKRMLRFAAENGYDKVAWTKGEQQAERYNLGGVVRDIQSYTNDDATKHVMIHLQNDSNIIFDVDSSGKIVSTSGHTQGIIENGTQLQDIVGKELAEKILNNEGNVADNKFVTDREVRELSGDGLRIGGEGMKGFYDQILPRFMDKYGKKWGVKTGEVRLDGLSGSNGENGVVMHAVDVTDDMRESVMRGQPLFREGEGPQVEYVTYEESLRRSKEAGYTKRQHDAWLRRYWPQRKASVERRAGLLNLGDRVIVVERAEELEAMGMRLTERDRRSKGWYDRDTGKIVMILQNHTSIDDETKTLLHEGVGHYGLRYLFGEHFDEFLDLVYAAGDVNIRREIARLSAKYGYDVRSATEEYLSRMAEDEDFERPEHQDWWRKVKTAFFTMLRRIGFDIKNWKETITDNELRYVLWRSYQNLKEQGAYRNLVEVAEDMAMQAKLKVGVFEEDRTDRGDRKIRADRKGGDEWSRAAAEAKRHWPEAMVLERVGDFYEVHGEDARNAAKVLGLPLVQKADGNNTVGFPTYAVNTYLPKLVRAGQRVAIVDTVNEEAAVYGGEDVEAVNARFNEELQQQIDGTLPKGHVYNLGMPSGVLLSTGIADAPIQLSATKLNDKSSGFGHDYDLSEVKDLVKSINDPIAVFKYGDEKKAQNIVVEIQHNGKNFIVGLAIRPSVNGRVLEINSIRNVFPKDNAEWLNWITQDKALYLDKNRIQALIDQQRTNLADVGYLDLNSVAKIVKKFENPQIPRESFSENADAEGGKNGRIHRDGDFTERDEVAARDYYERMVSESGYQFREAVQDSMLGLRKAMEAILGGGKKFRVEEVPGNENAYLAENRMSSVNAAEQHYYFVECMKPLLEEIHKICGSDKALRQELTDYMMAKHGLERNRVFAERDAAQNPKGVVRERDYAGLTALTGLPDVHDAELAAMQMVADFEAQHDVSGLWAATKQATGVTLAKIYRSGLLSKESYEQIRDQFEWYIPLQGFDETTSDEVYGYLTSRQGPYGSPIKHAEGRSSKADDPIATIGMMADMAIRQANRNEMKKLFLNFVLDHPSDLVSVNRLWLQHDDVSGDWMPVFADIEEGDTAADVERKVAAFEERMEQLAAAEPKKYKHGRNAKNIPYRVLPGNLSEHQVLVKRDGETYVLTINGNPRAAQALNGLTNPDVKVGGVVGDMMKAAEWVNHNLSAAYTTRTPDFVVSNYFRDMLYSNCMTWVKEGGNYALRFHKNFGKFNPATMRVLFGKWEKGKLDESKPIEFMFKQFMLNGGETGYTNVRDIEAHKREIARELKRQGNVPRKAWHALGMQLDLLNRSVENCARFAAFITSQEMGRSVERSIYDAKEVSVNFNKKGSGGKMVNATGQTGWGKFGSYLSGTGRLLYVFWNAGTQGMTNFMRAAKHHPGKFSAGAATMFALGAIIPLLAKAIGDDDDDENAYYNLPEYVRRSNICFRFTKEMSWITIPLPIEFRAIYGLGELGTGVITGDEHYNNWELARQLTSQVSQLLPLDMMEGGGGLHAFIPSLAKPIVEAANNKSWTGLPIYRDNPFNQKDPEFTKVYKNADKNLVAASKWLNELTGGDDYKKGWADKVNPAQVEYVLNGYLGGWFKVPNQLMKMGETAFGAREFEWRNMMLANRLIKNGDERTANRKLQNEYFELKDEYEETKRLLKKYKNAADEGVLKYAEKLAFLNESEEYGRYLIFDEYRKEIDKLYKQMKEEEGEQRKATEEEYYSVVREMVDKVHEYNKGR